MTTRLEYLLGMANDRSDWLLTSNPSLNYILVKDSGSLMYPEPSVNPLNRFFSTSGLTDECDECFKKAYKDFEEKLKAANNMSDTLAEIYDEMLFSITIGTLADFYWLLGTNMSIFLALWAAIEPELAYLDPAKAEEIRKATQDWLSKNGPGNLRRTDQELAKINSYIGQYASQAETAKETGNLAKWLDNYTAKSLLEPYQIQLGGWRTLQTLYITTRTANFPDAKAKKIFQRVTDTDLRGLLKKYLNIIAESEKPFAVAMRVIGRLLKNALTLAAGLGLLLALNDLMNLVKGLYDQTKKLCEDHRNAQLDLLAQKYAAADQYYRDLGKCYQAGCCDDPNPCKGIGGWCTRIRDGVNFSFFIKCCDACDCGGDTSCKYAYCGSCDPASKCANNREDDLDTNDTQTGSGTNPLPNYLFPQNPSTLQQGCPPVPPGWQRHPNGTDPDPRSSPEWDPWVPPPCEMYPGENWINDTINWWQEVFGGRGGGGGGGGGGTTTAAD